jgi:hypothetical protein
MEEDKSVSLPPNTYLHMFENPDLFWKNFRLGTELQVSGTFIYNALYAFDRLEHFHYEHEIFEFLYNISVGIERLEKIAIILLEGDSIADQEEFEKTLITHNHLELMQRICKLKELRIGKSHRKFLQLITEFYKSTRYSRYNLSSVYSADKDKSRFVGFLEEELGLQIDAKSFFPTPNDPRIKKYVGKLIGKICSQLYEIIREEAHRLRIFTYEIPYGSKAFKIFIGGEYTFETERILQKEILVHLMNGDIHTPHYKLIKDIPPIDLSDYYSIKAQIEWLFDIVKCQGGFGGLEVLYEENHFGKDRIERLQLLEADIDFDEDDSDELDYQ